MSRTKTKYTKSYLKDKGSQRSEYQAGTTGCGDTICAVLSSRRGGVCKGAGRVQIAGVGSRERSRYRVHRDWRDNRINGARRGNCRGGLGDGKLPRLSENGVCVLRVLDEVDLEASPDRESSARWGDGVCEETTVDDGSEELLAAW